MGDIHTERHYYEHEKDVIQAYKDAEADGDFESEDVEDRIYEIIEQHPLYMNSEIVEIFTHDLSLGYEAGDFMSGEASDVFDALRMAINQRLAEALREETNNG